MSFRVFTLSTANRMSSLIFVSVLLSVLTLTPQSIQAARRSRLDLAATNALNATTSATSGDNEKTVSPSAVNALNKTSSLALKTDQSLSADALPLKQESLMQTKDTPVAPPVNVDTGKSSATDLTAEDDKEISDSDLEKEQKEASSGSVEDSDVFASATQISSSGSGSHHHEECDSDMLGFEIVTG